ncbi:antibiotic resistance protein [Agrobacterium larrymoorei]|uniref:TfuA-like protein n=1 Tax=Agrobacterium larrymoorei TaxID=160699 RepID=UPI0015747CA8|nr:TfuA-like protein [Agrobacterium larrymoorei]NTJ44221.1 antibiotic resistance protein [Agrobacterium larrymoorei]
MKVLFVGPSLPGAHRIVANDIEIRPPACQGDIMRAVADGASRIGLIDGQFNYAAPVWHKEILFALSRDITVLGAASMGALRACECAAFGMVGVGAIFEDYMSGRRDDDSDVALLYGPEKLGYPHLTIPLVNLDATLSTISAKQMLDAKICQRIHDAARRIFFKQRSWKCVLTEAGLDYEEVKPVIDQCWTDQKKIDSLQLLNEFNGPAAAPQPKEWQFNATPMFRKLYM